MTDSYKPIYLAACEALYDDKPTEFYQDGAWREWSIFSQRPLPRWAKQVQWRPVDQTREYKEALAAGKRVEWQNRLTREWIPVDKNHIWVGNNIKAHRIVEPKTVRLYPFVVFDKDNVLVAYEYKTNIDIAKRLWPSYKVYPINEDGSIEVES